MGTPAPAGVSTELPLGATLRRDRLRQRARRLELVVIALEQRTRELERLGRPVPAPLGQAVGSFRRELGTVRRDLSSR